MFRWTQICITVVALSINAQAQLAGPPNGNFENGLTGWAHQFGTESVTADAHGGSQACRLDGNDAQVTYGQLNSTGFAVEPGARYTLSSYVKMESGTGRYMVTLAWLGGETVYDNAWMGTDAPSDWTEHGGTFTAPDGRTSCVIILGVDEGSVVLFDDITLTKVGDVPPPAGARHWQVWAAPDAGFNQNQLLSRDTEWAEARGLLRGLVLPDFAGSETLPWTVPLSTLAPTLALDGVQVMARAEGLAPGSTGGGYALGSLAMVGPDDAPVDVAVLVDPVGNVLQGARTAAPGGLTLSAAAAAVAGCVDHVLSEGLAASVVLEVNLPQWTFGGYPSPFGEDSWSAGSGHDLQAVLDAVLGAGDGISGIHALNPWDYYNAPGSQDGEKLLALEAYARGKGLDFGVVYTAGATAVLTDGQFHDQVIAMAQACSDAGVGPDVFVLLGGDAPGAYLPEKTQNTFMDTARDFASEIRKRYPKLFPGAVNDMLKLDNGTIQIGMDLKSGGAITYMSESGVDENIINIHDRGREIQQSYYAGDVLDRRSEGQSGSWSPWAWNPIQVGDYAGNSAEIIEAWIDGDVAFTRCIPLLWDMNNEPGQCYMDQWTEIEGNVAHVRNRLTIWRDPDDLWDLVAPRDQELPAVYTIADVPYLYTYVGEDPWTNGPLTEIDNDPNDGFIWDAFIATERWAANVRDRSGNGWGLGVYNKESTKFLGGLAGTVGGGPYDGSTAYISPLGRAALGRTDVYEYEYDLIMGTLDEIRQYVYGNPPENTGGWAWWQFNTDGDLEGWNHNDHAANVTVSGGFLRFDVTGVDPIFTSPPVAIIASETPYIHVRMKNNTTARSMQFFFTNAAGGPGTPGNDISIPVSANDTVPKDYVIDMRGAAGWTGVISDLRFDPVGGVTSGHIDVDYIAAWHSIEPPVADTEAPVITLLGDVDITMDCDQLFEEPGYSATDDTDGDLTDQVVVGGDAIDGTTPAPGTYTIIYDVTDSAGNPATRVTRTVTVTENCASVRCGHTGDTDHDCAFALEELLRCIQIYNAGAYHCAATADGYAPGPGDQACAPHSADYSAQDWRLDLHELLRVVQLYNSPAYAACVEGEDGFCPGA